MINKNYIERMVLLAWLSGGRVLSLCLAAGLAWLAAAGCSTAPVINDDYGPCVKVRTLRYHEREYAVPTNQTWRLTWSSPYKPYEITPAYDVRVSKGDVTVGDTNSFLVTKTDEAGEIGFLANSGPIVLWLSGGAHFYLANDLIRVHVFAYQIKSMGLKMVTQCSAEEGARICFQRLRPH